MPRPARPAPAAQPPVSAAPRLAVGRLGLRAMLASLTLSSAFAPGRAGAREGARLAGDAALSELAEGRPEAAARRIAAQLRRGPPPDEAAALRCVLGAVQLQAGQLEAAVATLSAVDPSAPCAGRAAFDHADALLAQGKVEAALARMTEAGARALGPERDQATAALIRRLSAKLSVPSGPPDPRQAQLAGLMLSLSLPLPELLIEAVAAAELERAHEAAGRRLPESLRAAITDVLQRALAEGLTLSGDAPGPGRARLLRIGAEMATGSLALQMAAELGAAPEDAWVRGRVALESDLEVGLMWLERAIEGAPDRWEWRQFLVVRLLDRGELSRAAPHLAALAAGAPSPAMDDALLQLATVEAALAPDAVLGAAAEAEQLRALLRRAPSSPRRGEAERRLAVGALERARAALALGRPAEAVIAYDAFLAEHPGHPQRPAALLEAALAAGQAGDPAEEQRRLEALLALGLQVQPALHRLTELRAARDGDAAALAWLAQRGRQGDAVAAAAAAEHARRSEPALYLQAGRRWEEPLPAAPAAFSGGRAEVQLVARGLASVELRLHQIDPEAFLRAGGEVDSLPELDVAVVAPDRQWRVPLPTVGVGVDRRLTLPVEVPGPGLYTLTAASDREEARVVLLHSAATVLLRARGEDLVIGVMDGEKPAARAPVWVATARGVERLSTDGDGLARLRVPEGEVRVLAAPRGGPAMAALRWSAAAPVDVPRFTVMTDRPVYLPGDTVGVHLVGREGDAPLQGELELWIEAGGARMPGPKARLDASGAWRGELRLPAGWGGSSSSSTARLRGQLKGGPALDLGRLSIAPATPLAHRSLRWDAQGPQVLDGRSIPVEGVAATYRMPGRAPAVVRSGEDGRFALPVPTAPGGVSLQLLGEGGSVAPPRPTVGRLALALPDDRVPAQGPLRLKLSGPPGTYTLRVRAALPARPPSPAPEAAPDPAGAQGFSGGPGWIGDAPARASGEHLRELDVVSVNIPAEGELWLSLPGLPEGEVRLALVSDDPLLGSAHAEATVGLASPGAVALRGLPEATAAGGRLAPRLEGAALLTLESDRVHAAALVPAGAPAPSFALPARHGDAALVATGLGGEAHARPLALDARLNVKLERQPAGGLRATVTDAEGRPVAARLSLRLLDARLLASPLATPLGAPAEPWGSALADGAAALGGPLWSAAAGEPISGALLAEATRQAQAERARLAGRGELMGTPLAEAMNEETPMSGVLGGIGTTGRGGGFGSGSGYGRGGGVMGGATGGRSAPAMGPALRERLLWAEAQADQNGVAEVKLGELPDIDCVLEVRAFAALGAGEASLAVPAGPGPRLRLSAGGALGPDDVLEPLLTVHNPGAQPVRYALSGDKAPLNVEVPAGGTAVLPLPPLRAGEQHGLTVREGGADRASAAVVATALPPQRPDPEGRLLRVRRAAAGGAPLAALAAESIAADLPELEAIARAGRAWIAVLNGLSGEERASAEQALRWLVERALALVGRGPPGSVAAEAELLAFLGEAGAALPAAPPTAAALDAAWARLEGRVADSPDRVLAAWAAAAAGRPADEPALGRLLREASALQPEERARLALALQLRGRPLPEGLLPPPGEGGALGALARRGAGLPVEAPLVALPAPGAPLRAEALALLAAAPPGRAGRKGPTLVYVNDVLVDTLGEGETHDLRRVVQPGDRVRVEGAAALVERGGLAAPDGAPPVSGLSRWTVAEDGAPLQNRLLGVPLALPAAPGCGDAAAPCALRLGEALDLPVPAGRGRALAPAVPAGLSLQAGRLVAESPGQYVVSGLLTPGAQGRPVEAAPLHLRVLGPDDPEAPMPLSPAAALVAAVEAGARGDDPRPWLAAWPAFDDWDAAARPEVMKLRWSASAGGAPAERVAAFEALRDAAPGATLSLAEVAEVAQAYRAVGQTTRALQVQRAGLSAAFLAEAAPLRRLEPIAGALVSLQAMRALVDRSPASPTVDEAEFHLAAELEGLADSPPAELLEQGMGAVDLRLLAAAWDREFLAFHPESPLRAQAGFQLARGLVQLGAFAEAARWAGQVADQSPADPALDALRLTEAVARMELGQNDAAQKILVALSTGDWPLEGGGRGPSGLAGDAAYALARAHEAAGRVEMAIEAYSAVAGAVPEAGQAAAALRRVRLELPALLRETPGGAVEMDVMASNLDTVDLRAYRLDLRTLFLRDGGLSGAVDVQVAGVSPAWSGERALRAGPYPGPHTLSLPLPGPGAYLVQASGGGVEARSLVVLSDLQLTAEEGPSGNRVVVRRGGGPAAGVELRALGGGAAEALRADARGVALAPSGSLVFAFDGEHVAFTDPSQSVGRPSRGRAPAAAPAPDLLQNLERRMKQQQERNEAQYDELYQPEGREGVDANAL